MVATVTALPMSSSAAGSIQAAIDGLRRAAEELSVVCSLGVNHAELAAAVVEVPSVSATVESALGAVFDSAATACVAQQEGFRRLDQMVLAQSNAAGVEVRALMRRSDWLRDFRFFRTAHAEGVLTVAHVEKIRRGLDTPRRRFLLRRDQELIVEAARTCDFKDFERFCDYWLLAADPDGAEPADQLSRSHFTARRQADGMVKVSGLLDPLSGQTLLTAWERAVQQLAVGESESDSRAGASGVSSGCRGVEALLALVAKGAARSDGSQPEPLVHLVMSQQVAEDTLRRLAEGGDVSPLPLDAVDIDRRCELIDGTPVHPFLVASVLGIAALQRTVMDAKGRPIETSYTTREWPKWLRHLVMVRTRGRCEADGCDAPYPWLQLDHKHPWSRGGPTRYANAQALCRPHNLAKGASE